MNKKEFARWVRWRKTGKIAHAKPQKCDEAWCDQRMVRQGKARHLIQTESEMPEEGMGKRE